MFFSIRILNPYEKVINKNVLTGKKFRNLKFRCEGEITNIFDNIPGTDQVLPGTNGQTLASLAVSVSDQIWDDHSSDL